MGADLNRLAVGDKITIKSGAYNIAPYNDGKPNGKFASFVYNMEFTVMQVGLGSDKGKRTNYVAFGIPGQGYTGAIAVEDIKTVTYSQPATPVTKPEETKPKETTKKQTPKQEVTNPYSEVETPTTQTVYSNEKTGSYVTYNQGQYGTSENSYPKESKEYQKIKHKTVTPRTIGDTVKILKGKSVNGDAGDPLKITSTRNTYDNDKNNKFAYPAYDKNTSTYDYTIDTDKFWVKSGKKTDNDDPLLRIEALHNISRSGRREIFRQKVENYFRFKYPNPNAALTKGFAHVFFTRPDLNVLERNDAGTGFKIPIACENDTSIYYAYRNNINLLKELVADNGMDHDFLFLLSNAAQSFSLLDEKIKTDEWARTWTGHTVQYGKHSNDSKTASTFEVEYTDDRNLNIYHLHKLWIDYIDKVYRGAIIPRGLTKQKDGTWAPPHGASPKGNGGAFSFTADKVLDYACSVYYILTAEDGESIIFWSKYYGVFPTIAPSSPFGWTYGDMIKNPKLTIEYAYSFKQDYDPFNLAEFNWLYRKPSNTKSTYKYVSTYNPTLLGGGSSRVGAPFIETIVNEDSEEPYQFKLRFRPVTESGKSASTYYKTTEGMTT